MNNTEYQLEKTAPGAGNSNGKTHSQHNQDISFHEDSPHEKDPITSPPVPKRGDIVWIHLSQTQGSETFGKRPAIVVSPLIQNLNSWVIQILPITSKVRGHGFEVRISTEKIDGVIQVNQIRSVDRRRRMAPAIVETAPVSVIREVRNKLKLLLIQQKMV